MYKLSNKILILIYIFALSLSSLRASTTDLNDTTSLFNSRSNSEHHIDTGTQYYINEGKQEIDTKPALNSNNFNSSNIQDLELPELEQLSLEPTLSAYDQFIRDAELLIQNNAVNSKDNYSAVENIFPLALRNISDSQYNDDYNKSFKFANVGYLYAILFCRNEPSTQFKILCDSKLQVDKYLRFIQDINESMELIIQGFNLLGKIDVALNNLIKNE